MKTTRLRLVFTCLFLSISPVRAADDLSTTLQRGLFEEEANHDLGAAIKVYESVVSANDTQRKLAATALFRLGECYRKLGRTNEAASRYERVVREYPDQPKLVELSREYLGNSAPTPAGAPRAMDRVQMLERELIEAKGDSFRLAGTYAQLTNATRNELRQSIATISPDTLLTTLLEQKNKTEQRLGELAQNLGKDHPDYKAAIRTQELIQMQIDERIDGIVAGLKLAVLAKQSTVEQLQKELAQARSASTERTPAFSSSSQAEQARLFQEEIKILEKDMEALEAKRRFGTVDAAAFSAKQRELLAARRELAALSGTPLQPGTANSPPEEFEVRRIQALIKDSPDLINAADGTGGTPLHSAASAGQLVVAKFLLANKAIVNARRQGNLTPLHEAISAGHKSMAELLIANGADVNAGAPDGWTPLHAAVVQGFKAIAEVLLANKANVNAVDASTGSTPLHIAAEKGFKSIAETLLENGADANPVKNSPGGFTGVNYPWDYRGRFGTALHMAVFHGDKSLTELLLARGANVGIPNPFGEPPLHIAAAANNVAIATMLLNARAEVDGRMRPTNQSQGRTALDYAAVRGHVEMVEFLLNKGADPNLRFSDGGNGVQNQTLLALVYSDHSIKNRDRIAASLLAHKADPNLRGSENYAPLHYVTLNPQAKIFAEMLLTNGADVEIRDPAGNTPLCFISGGKESVELLLDHKANPNAQNDQGGTPLHRLVERTIVNGPIETELAELLIAHGADVNLRNRQGLTPLNLYGVPAKPPTQTGIELARVLRQHGARDEQLDLEPDPNSIRIWRKGLTSGRVVFVRDAAGRNRFTLMEAIMNFYDLKNTPAKLAPRPATASVQKAQPRPQPGNFPSPIPPPPFAGLGGASSYDPVSEIAFPDLSRIRVLRWVDATKNDKKILATNLINAAGLILCESDLPLEFGDIVEIPEREYRLDETRVGLTPDQRGQFIKCLTRQIEVVVKGEKTAVKLYPVTSMAYLGAAMKLSPVRNVLRSSSDLSRLRIQRLANSLTGQPAGDVTVDLESFQRSNSTQWDDLWLRDGDVIEVPDRE